MSHEVETMAYAGETPWHGLGVPVDSNLSPAEMMKAAGLDWTVSKKKIRIVDGRIVPDKMALVRDSDKQYLSTVGTRFVPVQNEQAFRFFQKFCEAGALTMHTAGSLMDGKFVWALAKTQDSFVIQNGEDDLNEGFLLLMSPHILGKPVQIQHTAVRVVCWNTLSWSLSKTAVAGAKGKLKNGQVFKLPHLHEWDDTVIARAQEAVSLSHDAFVAYTETARFLASVKAEDPVQTEDFFRQVFKLESVEDRAAKQNERESPVVTALLESLSSAPGADLASAKGTWWGNLQAVTHFTDHKQGRTQDVRLRNAWFGYNQQAKSRALSLAKDFAEAV